MLAFYVLMFLVIISLIILPFLIRHGFIDCGPNFAFLAVNSLFLIMSFL